MTYSHVALHQEFTTPTDIRPAVSIISPTHTMPDQQNPITVYTNQLGDLVISQTWLTNGQQSQIVLAKASVPRLVEALLTEQARPADLDA